MLILIITLIVLIIIFIISISKTKNAVINSENTTITDAKHGDKVYVKNSKNTKITF
jgi:hypothetical protein